MVTARRASRTPTRRNRGRGKHASGPRALALPPMMARTLIGILVLVLGAVTLVAMAFPEAGVLNRLVDDWLRPAFGQGAWLLGVVLIVAGAVLERPPKVGHGWLITALGGLVLFAGGLGLMHLVLGDGSGQQALKSGGGAVGHWLAAGLSGLVSPLGAAVVLFGLFLAGVVMVLNVTLAALFRPVAGGGRLLVGAVTVPARAVAERAGAHPAADEQSAKQLTARPATPVEATPHKATPERTAGREPSPAPIASPVPLSQTVWTDDGRAAASQAQQAGVAPTRASTPEPRAWLLPGVELLGDGRVAVAGQPLDHARNIRIIEDKLLGFDIPASVTATNTGPVVTQYEVKPASNIKLSRIEGLADDLAMALAARSIRIEAPIPGKDVVGIEIPNHSSETVGFRRVYEERKMANATSKLTFALGRDVSGTAYAVDLARMPHLLIAGATNSGKSVCVNALITSLLMRATPDEVRLILIDLKRVELSAYSDLPHLEVPVLVEAHEARAVLTNLVQVMERRYELLAEAMERNIGAYNASERRIGAAMPYLVVVIDELADLMLREGRKVEDPVVKLAQKARAVGIHLVLATQRPSVNVVTGLIKANVPSRIAFAMASNVDSRTVLDAPGAEDLLGRGDMLFQAADMPRPIRLQGVFVTDDEVHGVAEFWRAQGEPEYDHDLLAGATEDAVAGGQFSWLARMAEDEMTARAAELVMHTGRASTSMLQTKLKIGFNRATRVMDELERYGVIGQADPRNPATPRTIYGPENWIRDRSAEERAMENGFDSA
jgi:S-DNA-T family DNA segregation ATPase FtsK/SpoIIIE